MQKYLTLLLIFSVVLGTPIFANSLTQDIAKKQEEVTKLQGEYNTLNTEATELQDEANALKTIMDDKKETMDDAKAEWDAKVTAYNTAYAAWQADQNNNTLKKAKDDAKDARDAAKSTYDSAKSAYDSAKSNYDNKQADANSKKSDATAKKADWDTAKAELAALQAILNSEPFKFLDQFDDFAAQNGEFDEDLADEVRDDIEKDANRYADFDAEDQNVQATYAGNSANYCNKANEKFDAMQSVFAANAGKSGLDNVKEQYQDQMGEFFKYYAKDMVDKPVDPDTGLAKYTFDGYLQDFDELNTSFEGDVANLSFENEEMGDDARIINPRKSLDKTMEAITAGAVKIDLGWSGVGNWTGSSNSTLYDVINAVKSGKLYNDNDVKKNAQWFTDAWQSTEGPIMDLPVNSTPAAYGGQFAADTSYVVNAYGQLVTDSNELSQYQGDLGDGTAPLSTYYNNQRFNSRQYGYSNGTSNVASVTVGKKKYVLQHTIFTSPIVLDMDGDGRLEASNGEFLPKHDRKMTTSRVVDFDLNGDGFMELVEWVGPNDGLLVQYTEGEISGHNLFGEAGGWTTGYEKLTLLDANKDMVLSGAELGTLSVWQDKNGDASVNQGEITTLKEAGIESINIAHSNLLSSFTQNGESKAMWDWFPMTLQIKRSE